MLLSRVTMQPCSILACDFTDTREMFIGFDDGAGITKIFFDNGSSLNLCFPHQTVGLNMNITVSLRVILPTLEKCLSDSTMVQE